MTFGLSNTGFKIKRFTDIRSDLINRMRESFGNEIAIDSNTVNGQFIDLVSDALSLVWEQLENVYNSQYRSSAEGFSLDQVAELVGINRKSASQTVVAAALSGNEGVDILSTARIRQPGQAEEFQVSGTTIISRIAVERVYYKVNVVGSGTYTVVINGVTSSFTASGTSTEADIINGLVTAINTNQNDVIASTPIGVSDTVLQVDQLTALVTDTTSDAKIDWYSAHQFIAVNFGVINAPQEAITEIVTPILNWNSVTNFVASTLGTEQESDVDLRTRILTSQQIAGFATLGAIQSKLFNDLDFVSQVVVFENTTDVTVNGRPPHSIEALLVFTDTASNRDSIAQKLFDVKGAGIQTFGNLSGTAVDPDGNNVTVFFSSPEPVPVEIIATLTLYDEEVYPTDGDDQVAQAIKDFGDSYVAGQDLLWQRYIGPIMTIPGIQTVSIQQRAPLAGVPAFVTNTDIEINDNQLATFDLLNITVNS